MTDLQFLNLDSMNSSKPATPFNTTWTLSNPLRQVKNIYIKSIELPINFLNVRNGTNTISLTYNNVVNTITLTSNQYTDINTLLTDINTNFTSNSINLAFSLNTNGYVTLNYTSGTQYYYQFQTTPLLNILGYTKNQLISRSNSLPSTATLLYNLNYDNYISLYLQNIPHNSKSVNQLCSFKIPLNAVNGVVYFNAENINFTQYITITDKNFVVDKISIAVYDKFGNTLNSSYDYSLTLAFDSYCDNC